MKINSTSFHTVLAFYTYSFVYFFDYKRYITAMLNYLKRTTNNFFEGVLVYCGEMLKSKTVEGELYGPTIAINGAASGTVPLDNGQ